MREAIRAEAAQTDAGWPTNPLEMRNEGGAASQTTINADTIVLYDWDLVAIPTLASITGISVRIDALKVDSGGTSSLKIGAELSWNSGGSWTSPVRYTPLLGLTQATFVLGGPDDLWGHAWTRTEIVNTLTFALRITAGSDAISGSPTWHVYFARPTIYYDQTGTSTQILQAELVGISERTLVSPRVIRTYENIAVFDSGSVPSGKVVERKAQQLKISGTAITTLQSSSVFPASSIRPRHREAIGCRLTSAAQGLDLFIGDATLLTQTASLSYPGTIMQPGLLDLGEVSHEADFETGASLAVCELRLMNREYVNQHASASQTPRHISFHVQQKAIIGGNIIVWSFAESGEGWQQFVIFEGSIEEIEFEESATTVRAVYRGNGAHPVPDIFVDSSLFTYEPGSSGVDTGEEIEGNRGKPVPIGLGRFDYGAVKKPADFASGHPFRQNNQSGPPSEDNKVYTQIALFPAMFGVKHPMMPTIQVARRFRRKNAEVGDLQFTSWPYQNVFLFGSRKSTPELRVMTGPTPQSIKNLRFPGRDATNYTTNDGENEVEYVTVWTWSDRGLPFVVPISGAHYGAKQQAVGEWAINHQGAGSMDLLGYPFSRGPNWSDGRALDCYGVFVNGQTPRAGALFPEISEYPAPRQAVALPMDGPTQFETRTKLYFDGPQNPKTPVFAMLEGTGQGFIENPRNAIDLLKLEDAARLQNTGYASFRLPLNGPSSGRVRGIRLCVLWNSTTTTAQNVYLFARLGPHNNYAILDASIIPDYGFFNKDTNVAFDKSAIDDTAGGFVHTYKLANITTATFASMWILPYFDPVSRLPTPMSDLSRRPATDNSPATPYATPKTEWNFTSMDFASLTSNVILEFPWDFMLHVRDLSGGTPIANRYLDLFGVWLEVHFDSPLSVKPTTTGVTGTVRQRTENWPLFQPWIDIPVTETTTEPAFTVDRPQGPVSAVYVTGKGAQDDASGSITGAANRIIEHPADIAQALIRHYNGETVFARRAVGSTFGSFATARTLLGETTYRMALVVSSSGDLQSVMNRIGRQSMAMIVEDLDTNGVLQWRMFVDTVNPEIDDPARMYRNNGFEFSLNHMAEGTFRCEQTPLEDLASAVRIVFGRHLPSGTWSDEKYVTPTSTNFAVDGSTYMEAMATSRRENGTSRELVVEAPDIWDPTVAETLAKWHCDRAVNRRVTVEFESFANAIDLQQGHVIRLADDVADRVSFPGDDIWSTTQLNVRQVIARKDANQHARVFIRATETRTPIA